eukprot:NODE_9984_length_454_cov_9.133333_g8883_i0.p4 GENE.NODE_9984_length_454_cov_9.133333_g8883_i0~~NODE_9984_length_454_cov_9.133333_g8883_i0.p4  ORF type:complete len:57 (+),score=0.42 NODE_9984_length_454_cov_9.133333_g8883_i0:174-344(+)
MAHRSLVPAAPDGCWQPSGGLQTRVDTRVWSCSSHGPTAHPFVTGPEKALSQKGAP